MRGCLTLKFFGSWKTVKGSLRLMLAEAALLESSRLSFSIASVGGWGGRTSVMVKMEMRQMNI